MNLRKLYSTGLLALAMLAGVIGAQAQNVLLGSYDFTGATGDQASQSAAGVLSPLVISDLTRSDSLRANVGANSLNSANWSQGTSPQSNRWVGLNLGVPAGFNVVVDSIYLTFRRSNSGPADLAVRVAANAYAQSVVTVGTKAADSSFALGLNYTIPAGTQGGIRFFGFNATSANGTGRFNRTMRLVGRLVAAGPFLAAAPNTINFGTLAPGASSAAVTSNLTGSGLAAQLTATAPTGFEVSNGGAFGASVNISTTGGAVTSALQVRFSPAAAGTFSDTVRITDGTYTAKVAVRGTGRSTPPLTSWSTILPYKSRNAAGAADSLSKVARVRGVVYGSNFYNPVTGGVQFTLIDHTAGINIRMVGNTTYTVTEGDSVEVEGPVAQFRGLIQINATAITRISGTAPLRTPRVVNGRPGVGDVSEFIRINGLTVVPGTWPTTFGPTVTGFTARAVRTANTNDTVDIRIVIQTNVFGSTPPTGTFDIIGLGGQFAVPSSATLGGYQITPRSLADIIPTSAPTGSLTITPTAIPSFGQVLVGTASNQFFVTARGTGLTSDVTVNVPAGFEVTLTNNTFTAGTRSVTIPRVADSIRSTRVYVRFAPTALGLVSGNGTATSGTNTATFSLDGTGIAGINEYTIARVTPRNATTGVLDSLGIRCTLRGRVYGINTLAAPRAQFLLKDYTGGINVRRTTPTLYVVTEGDSIVVTGRIAQFRGLPQIEIDTITRLGQGLALQAPRTVTDLDLTTVNDLVAIEPVELVAGTWPSPPSLSFNAEFRNPNSGATYSIRILSAAADIFNAPAPTGLVRIQGIGTQFAPTGTSLGGYQLAPRYLADITPVTSLAGPKAAALKAWPNPASAEVRIALPQAGTANVRVLNALGQQVMTTEVQSHDGIAALNLSALNTGVYTLMVSQGATNYRATVVKE